MGCWDDGIVGSAGDRLARSGAAGAPGYPAAGITWEMRAVPGATGSATGGQSMGHGWTPTPTRGSAHLQVVPDADVRQIVEAVHSLLIGRLGLHVPPARSGWGVLTRLAATVAAFNIALLLNALSGRTLLSLFNPLEA